METIFLFNRLAIKSGLLDEEFTLFQFLSTFPSFWHYSEKTMIKKISEYYFEKINLIM